MIYICPMKRFLFSLVLFAAVSTFLAQTTQINQQVTEAEMPLKTVLINESSAERSQDFWSSLTILRFNVYRAGTVADVQKVLDVFGKDPAVKSIKEGDVNGDNKEFVLTLEKPQKKEWYLGRFKEAGLSHISINEQPAVPLH